jgi:hypothetical protein
VPCTGSSRECDGRDSWSVGLLVWVMNSSATVGLVRQAKEMSLDLQLVGDLSGRRSRVVVVLAGCPCVWKVAGS